MKKFKKVTAFVLALLMLIAYVPAGLIDGLFVTKVKAESKTYTLDASEIEKFAAGKKTDGQIVSAGENDYFSIVASAKTAVQDNSKTFADGKSFTNRINFGGNSSVGKKNCVSFTTTSAAKVTAYYIAGGNGRYAYIQDSEGNVTDPEVKSTATNQQLIETYALESAGTYTFANANGNNYLYGLIVTESDSGSVTPEITYVKLQVNANIAKKVTTASYPINFSANADGKITIKKTGSDGVESSVVEDFALTANKAVNVATVQLEPGDTRFSYTFTPDADYQPSKYQKMDSYEPVSQGWTVNYDNVIVVDENTIFVSNSGKSSNAGTKESPLDIYTAMKNAKAGQTILLMGGEYVLSSAVTVPETARGTADKHIIVMADPDNSERPVFNFSKKSAGFILNSVYTDFSGFDVTGTSDGTNGTSRQKGIQVSGHNLTLTDIHTYSNGNTGIQVSGSGSDTFDKWPSEITIQSCISYNNADVGNNYEDADGFAAKLTVGNNVVFDNCISYNNADDGWDLYAKPETGQIGAVTISNCVAYNNGYLLDGTDAGDGNGFKLGGMGIEGGHMLINSVAYNNKAKGIDSNSCPDIKVTNCTSFDNEKANVAFYTKNPATTTDFEGTGIISFRKNVALTTSEIITPIGDQDTTKIYKDRNYYWNGSNKTSTNTLGDKITEDMFVSLDTKGITPTIENGKINMHGLLELTSKAPSYVGARINTVISTKSYDDILTDNSYEILEKDGLKYLSGFAVNTTVADFLASDPAKADGYTVSITNADDSEVKTDSNCKTGLKLTASSDSETYTYYIVIYGDINGDGAINVNDIAQVQKSILRINTLTGAYYIAAHVSSSVDSEPNVLDIQQIQKNILGISTISQKKNS